MMTNDKNGLRHGGAIGSNPGRNRAHNRKVVLEVVRTHGHLGRTEIARFAHLTPQAVANIVEELVAENLLIELGRLRSGRGQPPIQFAVNPDGPMTAGVEIAATHMVIALVDLSGKVRAQAFEPLASAEPEYALPMLAARLGTLRAGVTNVAPYLLGVGVVMPGPFEVEAMSSVGPATLPGWSGVDALALLAEATGETVSIENDANAAAVGERLYGAGRALSNFCFVYFGAGLGLGMIQDGRPMRGAFGNAGEIGHMVVAPRGRMPDAEGLGPLERYASVYALRERLAMGGITATGLADLQALHERGEPIILDWITEAADYLAPMVANLENILDPQTIIFGGALPDGVIDAIIAALEPLPVSVATRTTRTTPRVVRGQTGQLTAALGAAALPLLETMTPTLNLASGPAEAEHNAL